MKNENAFNAWLSKELRKQHPKLFHLKASDRFTEGVSDFLIWYSAHTFAVEVKFVKKWPSNNAQLLGHPFTGAQITFLESMTLAGNIACGIVAVEETSTMYLIPWEKIPPSGNWCTLDFINRINQHEWLQISWEEPKLLVAALVMKRLNHKNG